MDSFIKKAIEIRWQMADRTINAALEYSLGSRHGITYRDLRLKEGSDFAFATLLDREDQPAVFLRAHPIERKWDTFTQIDPLRVITPVQAIDLLDCVIDSTDIDEAITTGVSHKRHSTRFSNYIYIV